MVDSILGSSSESIEVSIDNDEDIKILGELFGNKISRDMIKLLIDDKMYSNEICQKLEIKSNTIVRHLKRLMIIPNLLEITNKKINKKGTKRRYLHVIPSKIVIVLRKSKKKDNVKKSKEIFKEGIKITSICIAGFLTWIFSLKTNIPQDSDTFASTIIPANTGSDDARVLALLVVIGGLLTLYFLEKKKKK